MVHLSRAAHGGLAIGVGAFGSADDWGFGTTGVMEPRRPLPGLGGDTVALDPRDDV